MPEITPESAARTLLENIDLWAEYALGAKDFASSVPVTFRTSTSRNPTLLDEFYEMHRSFMSGAVSEVTWNDAKSALRMLMRTTWFREEWESRETNYSEEFSKVIRAARTNVATRPR
jgi:hypothetical protein